MMTAHPETRECSIQLSQTMALHNAKIQEILQFTTAVMEQSCNSIK
jgi:hypothetical protein